MCFQKYWQRKLVKNKHWSSRRWLQAVIRMKICNFKLCPAQTGLCFYSGSVWCSNRNVPHPVLVDPLSLGCGRGSASKGGAQRVHQKEVPTLSCCAIPATHPAPGLAEGFQSPTGSQQTLPGFVPLQKAPELENSRCGAAQLAAQSKVTK